MATSGRQRGNGVSVSAAAALAVIASSGACAQRAAPAPSAREVAAELARSPEFARAVADELARRGFAGAAVDASAEPDAGAAAPLSVAGDVVAIAVDRAGNIAVDGQRVSDTELTTVLRTRVAAAPSLRATLTAEQGAAPARFEQVAARVRAAGLGTVTVTSAGGAR